MERLASGITSLVDGLQDLAGAKTALAIVAGLLLSPLVYLFNFIDAYVWQDWAFIGWLAGLVVIDTALGFLIAFNDKRISSRGFGRVLPKVGGYILFLLATHALASYEVNGEQNTFFGWIDSVAYATVMSRECLSILENLARLKWITPPQWLVERLESIETKGK